MPFNIATGNTNYYQIIYITLHLSELNKNTWILWSVFIEIVRHLIIIAHIRNNLILNNFVSFPSLSWWWISIAHVSFGDDRMTPGIHCIWKRSHRGTQKTDWVRGEKMSCLTWCIVADPKHTIQSVFSFWWKRLEYNPTHSVANPNLTAYIC